MRSIFKQINIQNIKLEWRAHQTLDTKSKYQQLKKMNYKVKHVENVTILVTIYHDREDPLEFLTKL